jgi:hypothetical protein
MRQPMTSDPVLLGGENRSGTTLLSLVLDSHADLVVGPEIDFVEPPDLGPHIIEACELVARSDPRVLGPGTDTNDPFWYDGAHFVKQCQRFGVDFGDLRLLVEETMAELGTDLSDLVDRCRLIDRIGEYRRAKTGTSRWGLKLQRKIARVDDYERLWPKANFVHIIRDGRDVAASHLRSVPWGFTSIEEAARGWLEVVGRPHTVADPDRYLEIRYEDLTADPERTLRRVTEHIGVSWNDALLNHDELPHTLFANPWGHPAAQAAARPMAAGRAGRYLTDLTPEQIATFEAIAGAELRRLGYELQTAAEDATTTS